MIPKIIHYCWFGRNPLPELAIKCINSWKQYCSDYEIIEWNEHNFDLNMNTYVAEAYAEKKWAFVTDYVRLYVMVKYGGIYMDTDVEVIKPLDRYLVNHAFTGFETGTDILTGIMACEKGFALFQDLLNLYEGKHFVRSDGSYDMTTNVYTITKYCLKHGFIPNNTYQIIEGLALYPSDFFCPKDHQTGVINCTDNTCTIHHFAGSWNTDNEKKWRIFENKICKYSYGKKIVNSKIVRLYHLVYVSGIKGIKWKIKELRGK